MKVTPLLILSLLLVAPSCAPSPLYVSSAHKGTPGEIPRDGRGQPIWDAIPPPPPPPGPVPVIETGSGPKIQHLEPIPGE